MTFIVGFSKARSPWKVGSKLIQEGEKRNFSHAYIKYMTEGMEVVAQASHGYVNQISVDRFNSQNITVEEYIVTCTDQDMLNIKQFVIKNLGAEYSKLQLLLLGIKKILHFEIPVDNKDSKFICSEFALRILDVINLPDPVENKDYETPSDLQRLVSSLAVLIPDKIVRKQI